MKARTKASPGVGKDRKDLKYFGVEYYGLGDQSVATGEGGVHVCRSRLSMRSTGSTVLPLCWVCSAANGKH